MRTNHDCQYLFTQIHALTIIYYTIKYISKAEENTHSKLTIAAAVAKALTTAKPNGRDHRKSMLIKTYNRLSSHREVGIPEALSHLLDYPDALTVHRHDLPECSHHAPLQPLEVFEQRT